MAVTASEPDIRRAPALPHSRTPALLVSPSPPLLVSPSPALALLDGRYQLLRQLSGPAQTPLMVASDLQTGEVVCIRLQRFTTAMAHLTAVPLLAPAPPTGDGPLLPRDFGVDECTAYLVREFVTATSLQQLLDGSPAPQPLEVVTILRRAGDALLAAAEQGFSHPGLALRHLLVTADGAVRVSGYDQMPCRRARTDGREGEMLALLSLEALAGAAGSSPLGSTRLAATTLSGSAARYPAPVSRRAPPAADIGAVRALLIRCQTWQSRTTPNLEAVVRQLRQCEQQLLGYSRLGDAVGKGRRITAALLRRFRRLGPLLHPYLFVLTLVTAIIVFAAHTLAAPTDPGRLLVYPIPTRAAADAPINTVFASPPQLLVTATATISTAMASASTPTVPSPATAVPPISNRRTTIATSARQTQTMAPVAPTRRVYSPPVPPRRTVSYVPAKVPTQATVARSVTTTPLLSRATLSQTTTIDARSTVIVTRLTAEQTTARVTVIAATTAASSVATAQTARPTGSTSIQVTTASALHPMATVARTVATTTAGKATANVVGSSVTKQVAVLR